MRSKQNVILGKNKIEQIQILKVFDLVTSGTEMQKKNCATWCILQINNWQLNGAPEVTTYGKNPQPTNHHADTTTEQLQELLTIISNFME